MVIAYLVLASLQANLQQKVKAMLPTAEESKWLSIPWRTDLGQARADAMRERKPIFMWIMNGHPLGCT